MNPRALLLTAFIAASVIPLTAADVQISINAEIRLGRALPPPPPEVVVEEHVGPVGPPPWAKRHWYRRDYGYYYYPGCDVYYRPSDHMWFYLDGGNWRAGVRLPDSITIDFGHSVSLTLQSDRPYTYNDHVVAYYPRDYFSRVKIRHDNRVDRRQDRRDDHQDNRYDKRQDDDRGNGKGKGKGKDKRRNND